MNLLRDTMYAINLTAFIPKFWYIIRVKLEIDVTSYVQKSVTFAQACIVSNKFNLLISTKTPTYSCRTGNCRDVLYATWPTAFCDEIHLFLQSGKFLGGVLYATNASTQVAHHTYWLIRPHYKSFQSLRYTCLLLGHALCATTWPYTLLYSLTATTRHKSYKSIHSSDSNRRPTVKNAWRGGIST